MTAMCYRVDSRLASTCDDDIAVQRAENEGLRPIFDEAGSSLFSRVSSYLRSRFAPSIRKRDRTLEELLADLKAAEQGDAQLRRRSAALMALMASDIQSAKHFSIESSLTARSMRAWRQRYNGIDLL